MSAEVGLPVPPSGPSPGDRAHGGQGVGDPVLVLDRVSKSYAGRLVIKKATLTLHRGLVLALTGPSGVGKSTLLEIMAGLVKPDSGTRTATGRAALMFQDDALVPWLGALDNLLLTADPAVHGDEAGERAAEWLGFFELDRDLFPGAMSEGTRRRLNLARALYAGRPLVLLDEPFAFLDEGWRVKVAGLIASEAARGAAVALTDHGDGVRLENILGDSLSTIRIEGPEVELEWPPG